MYKQQITPIIFSKQDVIVPACPSLLFKIHKGANFRILKPSRFSVGFKFGEFTMSRKPNTFIKKKPKTKTRR